MMVPFKIIVLFVFICRYYKSFIKKNDKLLNDLFFIQKGLLTIFEKKKIKKYLSSQKVFNLFEKVDINLYFPAFSFDFLRSSIEELHCLIISSNHQSKYFF